MLLQGLLTLMGCYLLSEVLGSFLFGFGSNRYVEFLFISIRILWEESLNFQVKLEPSKYFTEPQNINFMQIENHLVLCTLCYFPFHFCKSKHNLQINATFWNRNWKYRACLMKSKSRIHFSQRLFQMYWMTDIIYLGKKKTTSN